MDILNLIVGAERAENRVEQSGAVSGRCRKTMERSAQREVTEQERSGGRGVTEIRWSAERLFRRSDALVSMPVRDIVSACSLFVCLSVRRLSKALINVTYKVHIFTSGIYREWVTSRSYMKVIVSHSRSEEQKCRLSAMQNFRFYKTEP